MLKIVVRSDRASGGLRRSYVKTVGVQIAPVEFSLGAIFTLTDFTKFLLGLIASQFTNPQTIYCDVTDDCAIESLPGKFERARRGLLRCPEILVAFRTISQARQKNS